jgi:transposase InsO family protein
MVSPARRREAVRQVRSECKDVSERRACNALKQPRSTQRYRAVRRDDDEALVKRMLALVGEHPRYGYRRIGALLHGEGFRVNRKRVYRLWRREGLKVPKKQRKHRRLGTSANGCVRRRAEHMNHVWSYDFVMDQTIDSRPLKLLPIVDEYTRECLSIDVERSLTASAVIETLRQLFAVRGAPQFIRSDNGPEFVARAVRDWLAASGVDTLYIEPGSPWENAYSESFNSRFRDELLDRELFVDLRESRVVVEDYRLDYNHVRPHSALGYQTPAAFAATCLAAPRNEGRPLGAPPPNPRLLSPPREAVEETPIHEKKVPTLITTGT